MGGTTDVTVNINQLDPSYLSLGTGLQQLVPNPFFGNAAFGNLSRSSTIARGQLLRPFPQFTDVFAHRVNQARSRYDALAVKWDRRMKKSWAASANYTYSRLMDNQFGESNTFSNRLGTALDNTNLDGEYGYSLLDVPHRVNLNATVELTQRHSGIRFHNIHRIPSRTHTHTHSLSHTHIHIPTHTHTHTYTHKCTHTHPYFFFIH